MHSHTHMHTHTNTLANTHTRSQRSHKAQSLADGSATALYWSASINITTHTAVRTQILILMLLNRSVNQLT